MVVIVESDTGTATQLRAEYGAGKVRDTLAEVLAMPEVDALILCTPTVGETFTVQQLEKDVSGQA